MENGKDQLGRFYLFMLITFVLSWLVNRGPLLSGEKVVNEVECTLSTFNHSYHLFHGYHVHVLHNFIVFCRAFTNPHRLVVHYFGPSFFKIMSYIINHTHFVLNYKFQPNIFHNILPSSKIFYIWKTVFPHIFHIVQFLTYFKITFF